MNRLPQELYGELIPHIQDQKDIFSISKTSRSLYYAALPSIWRSVTAGRHSDDISIHLSTHPWKAKYIHFIHIDIREQDTTKSLQIILRASINLKILEVYQTLEESYPVPPIFLGDLTNGTTFKLHRLVSTLGIKPSCANFFKRQDQLVEWAWVNNLGPGYALSPTFLSSNDLRALKVHATVHGDISRIVLPGRNITHVKWYFPPLLLLGQYDTVQVLASGVKPRWNEWDKFPNLQFMTTSFYGRHFVTQLVENLRKLKYISVFHTPGVDSYEASAAFSRELYSRNSVLEGVEIIYYLKGPNVQRWRLGKTCDLKVPASPPMGLPGIHDWKKW